MRSGNAALLALVVVPLGGACDWREFDELKKKTPVAAITAPSSYPASSDFGANMLAVSPPSDGSAAGRFVVSATQATSLAVVSVSASGGPSGMGVDATVFDNLNSDPITAMAEVPGKGKVLLGVPARVLASADGFGDVLLMDLNSPSGSYPISTFRPLVAEDQYGVGVAAGNIGGGDDPEVVVLSETTLHVYVDSMPTSDHTHMTGAGDPCPLPFSMGLKDGDRVNRAVIIASFTGSAKQIAVGTPGPTGVGAVSIFDFDVATGTFTCAMTLTQAEPRFGRAMVLADLLGADGLAGGDGVPDHLVVGAPPTRAYLYRLPLVAGATAMAVSDPEPMPGSEFGAALAAIDLDGAGDEVFIGNPGGELDGKANAGRVSIFTGPTLSPVAASKAPNPLTEPETAAGHGYGAGIIGMTFCPGAGADAGTGTAPCTRLPIVGALSTVYAYFTLRQPDPRVK
jgi:hypothetical protein